MQFKGYVNIFLFFLLPSLSISLYLTYFPLVNTVYVRLCLTQSDPWHHGQVYLSGTHYSPLGLLGTLNPLNTHMNIYVVLQQTAAAATTAQKWAHMFYYSPPKRKKNEP